MTHNSEREDESPKAGHGVSLDGLPRAHGVLAILAIKGIVHQFRVDQDLGLKMDIFLLEILHIDLLDLVRLILLVDGTRRHCVSTSKQKGEDGDEVTRPRTG